MAAIRKIKAERNGDIIIPTELARLAGVMPNMEVHVVVNGNFGYFYKAFSGVDSRQI